MPNEKPIGRAMRRIAFCLALAAALPGCKSLSLSERAEKAGTAELAADAASGKTGQAEKVGVAENAYSDPYLTTANAPDDAAAPFEAAQIQADDGIGAVVMQPTGIRAGQASIFSVSSPGGEDPAAPPAAPAGALLPAAAYAPAPGVKAALYSVYGGTSAPPAAE